MLYAIDDASINMTKSHLIDAVALSLALKRAERGMIN